MCVCVCVCVCIANVIQLENINSRKSNILHFNNIQIENVSDY